MTRPRITRPQVEADETRALAFACWHEWRSARRRMTGHHHPIGEVSDVDKAMRWALDDPGGFLAAVADQVDPASVTVRDWRRVEAARRG